MVSFSSAKFQQKHSPHPSEICSRSGGPHVHWASPAPLRAPLVATASLYYIIDPACDPCYGAIQPLPLIQAKSRLLHGTFPSHVVLSSFRRIIITRRLIEWSLVASQFRRRSIHLMTDFMSRHLLWHLLGVYRPILVAIYRRVHFCRIAGNLLVLSSSKDEDYESCNGGDD